jgi:hypothetical protein
LYNDTDTVVRSTRVVGASVGDDAVMLNLERGQYLGLGGIGPRVWELLQDPLSVDEIAEFVFAEYAAADLATCRSDIRDFVARLSDLGLVELA